MTEASNTITNYIQSVRNSDDNPIDWFAVLNHQREYTNDRFGLYDNDDDDDDNLTLFDLKPPTKNDHDLSIFDELAHQCDAVLLATNLRQKTVVTTSKNNSHLSNIMTTTTTTTTTTTANTQIATKTSLMMNDYEKRFEYSLQKLTVPTWYNDVVSPSRHSNKRVIISSTCTTKESIRTPEIVHINRPRSYRSCRSSTGTSPSPSVHSWHPNHLHDGTNVSASSHSRHTKRYERGIERVAKSSHWYQPAQLVPERKKHKQHGASKTVTIQEEKLIHNHSDGTKVSSEHDDVSNKIKQSSASHENDMLNLLIQEPVKPMIDDIDFDGFENTNIMPKNNRSKNDSLITDDKQNGNYMKFNEIEKMSLTNEKDPYDHVELEEVTDDEDNDKRSSIDNADTSSNNEVIDNNSATNAVLERIANKLVDSILNEALHTKVANQDDDMNTGVRELSDDENGLRELDENDMSGTDEFIVFATQSELPDHQDDHDTTNQPSPGMPRGSFNRLYTFSRTNDDPASHLRKTSTNQDSSTSVLTIADKDTSINTPIVTTEPDQPLNTMVHLDDNNDSNKPPSTYRSHIQKRHINLGRYYDGMMRATSSQLPTHDLRSHSLVNKKDDIMVSEGVNEETVRQGRIILDSIPNPNDINDHISENISNSGSPTPIRSILKHTRYSIPEEEKSLDNALVIHERTEISPRKITKTTITDEYHLVKRRTVEEFEQEFQDEISYDSDKCNVLESITTEPLSIQSPYEKEESPYGLLSECYSGYSNIQSDFLTPAERQLTLNVSSLQSTTDEAYESEPTTTTVSLNSPAVSSSPVSSNKANVHPDLEHEFEYPSPPPPVPDRSLKPARLRAPPPTKPRHHRPQQRSSIDATHVRKETVSPLTVIRHLMDSLSDDATSSSTRTISSRHFCGSIPQANDLSISLKSQTKLKTDNMSEQSSRTHTSLNTSFSIDSQPKPVSTKSPSSLNRTRVRQALSASFDEATNGLPIQLPEAMVKGNRSVNKQNLDRSLTPTSRHRVDRPTKQRPISENINPDRSSTYETSV